MSTNKRLVICIEGKIGDWNEYVDANRKSPYCGNRYFQDAKNKVIHAISSHSLKNFKFKEPVKITYTFIEPYKKRDKDNIAGFAHKAIMDALVDCGVIENDGWDAIARWDDNFRISDDMTRGIIVVVEEYATKASIWNKEVE